MKKIIPTDEAYAAIARALEGLEEQRNRTYALVSAVRNNLSAQDIFFNEIQLLDMAEEMLGDDLNLLEIKTCLGMKL